MTKGSFEGGEIFPKKRMEVALVLYRKIWLKFSSTLSPSKQYIWTEFSASEDINFETLFTASWCIEEISSTNYLWNFHPIGQTKPYPIVFSNPRILNGLPASVILYDVPLKANEAKKLNKLQRRRWNRNSILPCGENQCNNGIIWVTVLLFQIETVSH